MEISPIPGIRAVQLQKVRPADSELAIPFEIESTARAEDDTYSPRNKKASGAEEPDEDAEEELDEFPDEAQTTRSGALRKQGTETGISFFA